MSQPIQLMPEYTFPNLERTSLPKLPKSEEDAHPIWDKLDTIWLGLEDVMIKITMQPSKLTTIPVHSLPLL